MKSRSRGARFCLRLMAVGMIGIAPASKAKDAPPVQLEKFVVNAKHLLCFGVALSLWEDKNTHRVLAIYVKDVQPESMAEQKGLRPGTRIWSIDGVPAESFEASFDTETELGKKFVNRKRGEVIVLEVKAEGERQTRMVSLTQSPLTMTIADPASKRQ